MTLGQIGTGRSFRMSGALLLLGLSVEAGSLLWSHPIAFLLFVSVGGFLTLAGTLLYLYSLLPASHASNRNRCP